MIEHKHGEGADQPCEGPPRKYEQPPDLDEEDEEILNRIWDKIGRERREAEGRRAGTPAGAEPPTSED
jgi:hypothetical protein